MERLDFVSWLAIWGVILGLSVAAFVRMFRRGRIESHSQLSLLPPKVRSWVLGESEPKKPKME